MRRLHLRPLLLLALTACGSGGPSHSSFVADAAAACKPLSEEATRLSAPADVPSVKRFGESLAALTNRTVEAVEKVEAGEEDKARVRSLVELLRAAAASTEGLAAPAAAFDYEGLGVAAKAVADAYGSADKKAHEIGVAECGAGQFQAATRFNEGLGPMTKQDFVGRVNPICVATARQLEKYLETDSRQEARAKLDRNTARMQKMVDEIKAIKPPVYERDKLDEVMVAWEAVVKAARAASASPSEALFDAWDAAYKEFDTKVFAYGIKHC